MALKTRILLPGDTAPTFGGSTLVDVRLMAPGGSGASGEVFDGYGGGGGGAYVEVDGLSVSGTPDFQLGTGGSELDTWFKSAGDALAKAGLNANVATAGAGGTAAASVGTVKRSGGNGGNGGTGTGSGGGGGGGAGGPDGDGKNGGRAALGDFNGGSGGGGGSNGGSSTAGSNASGDAGANGGHGNAGTGRGTGGAKDFDGTDATAGSGAGGGGAGEAADGGHGAMQPIFTDDSGGPNHGLTVGPGGGGGGGSGGTHGVTGDYRAGDGGGYGSGSGGGRDVGAAGDGFIVIIYEDTAEVGEVTATLGAITSVSTGSLDLEGAVTATLGAITAIITAGTFYAGEVTAALGAVTAVSTGELPLEGAVTATLGAVTSDATGSLPLLASGDGQLGAIALHGEAVKFDPFEYEQSATFPQRGPVELPAGTFDAADIDAMFGVVLGVFSDPWTRKKGVNSASYAARRDSNRENHPQADHRPLQFWPDSELVRPFATGGVRPYTYSIAAGSLPSGVTLDPDTGQLIGTPGGAETFTLRVVDAAGAMIESYITMPFGSAFPYGPELIENGTFDEDIAPWAPGREPASQVLAWNEGTLEIAATGANAVSAQVAMPTTIGETYRIEGTVVAVDVAAALGKADTIDGAAAGVSGGTPGERLVYSFAATASTTYIHLVVGPDGASARFDNVTVREVLS